MARARPCWGAGARPPFILRARARAYGINCRRGRGRAGARPPTPARAQLPSLIMRLLDENIINPFFAF